MRRDQIEKCNVYIPQDHLPHAEAIREVFITAQSELIRPAIAVPLKRFPKLNVMTGGFRPYEFSLLCGATGVGKTTLGANLSLDLMENSCQQFIASVETGHTDWIKRMISAKIGIDWNTGDAVPFETMQKFEAEYGKVFKTGMVWLSLYDNRTSVESLMADLATMVRDNGVRVAFIDNLNFFLEITSAANAIIEMDRVIHELIIFCKQVPLHIVMIVHPKKTESGRVESEFDIKGSSTAVQEAHNVFLFNRAHPDLIKAGIAVPGDRELMIAKMRRRGKYVRRRLIIKSTDGVCYQEGEIV